MQKNVETLKIDNGDKTLIHFHGFTSCKEENKNLMQLCKDKNISYYAIDFPGQGNSHIDSRDKPSLEYFAKIAVNFIKSLNKTGIILSGHSMGGAIALMVANILGPNVISEIILENPVNHGLLDSEKDRINLLNLLKSKSSYIKNDDGNIIDVEMNDLYRKWYKDLAEDLVNHDTLDLLNKICQNLKIKVTILYGINDQIVPYNLSVRAFKSIQSGNEYNILEIENAGHVPHNENYSKYIKLLDNIL